MEANLTKDPEIMEEVVKQKQDKYCSFYQKMRKWLSKIAQGVIFLQKLKKSIENFQKILYNI